MANSRIVLLPVYKGMVQVTIDKGYRWSDIEHLLLVGLCQSEYTISELMSHSNLPSEVLLEAIHRLMRVGWVEIYETEGRIAFRATLSGLAEADKESLTPMSREQTRKLHFVIDRLTNTVFRSRDFVLLNENSATRLMKERNVDSSLTLPSSIYDQDLPTVAELVEPLLSRDEEFVTYNEDKSEFKRDFYAKLVVTDDEIEGLPENAGAAFRSQVLASVRGAHSIKLNTYPSGNNKLHPIKTWPTCPIELDKEDICIGGKAHDELFDLLLRNARRRVVIHSTFIRYDALEKKLDIFAETVRHGAEIDILWDKGESNNAGKKLRECRKLISDRGLSKAVRIQPTSTGSHAKLLVADDGQGNFLAVLGSCNWLYSGFDSLDVSILLRNRKMVFDCLEVIERLIHRPRFHDAKLRADIVALRREIRPSEDNSGGSVQARLLSLGCHEEIIELARDTAQRNIFVASHKLGGPVETQMLIPLASAAEARSTDVSIYYQVQSGAAVGEAVRAALEEKYTGSVTMSIVRSAHAKLLCWDDDHVVITSLNWLSKDIDAQKQLSEVGLYVKGDGLANYVRESYLSGCKATI